MWGRRAMVMSSKLLLSRRAGRQRLRVAGPDLAPADQGNANITPQAQRAIGLQPHFPMIGVAALGVVDVAVFPVVWRGRLEPVHKDHAAKRLAPPRRIGVVDVDRLGVRVAGLDAKPGQFPAELVAARENLDNAALILRQPTPRSRGTRSTGRLHPTEERKYRNAKYRDE